MILYVALLGGEAIEEPVATRGNEVWLGATARRVGRIPGARGRRIGLHILGTSHWRIARAISVSEHCDAGTAAGPVLTGKVHDPAVLLRSYAKRTPKADEKAAAVIGSLLKGVLG